MSDDSKAEAARALEDAVVIEEEGREARARGSAAEADCMERAVRALRCYAAVLDPGDDAKRALRKDA